MEGAELSDFTTQEPAPSTLTNRDRAANAERSEIDVDHHSLENQAQYPPVDKVRWHHIVNSPIVTKLILGMESLDILFLCFNLRNYDLGME